MRAAHTRTAVPSCGHFYLCERHRIAYLSIPKCGCTSLINMLHRAQQPGFSCIGTRVHRESALPRVPVAACPRGYFRFAVVRDPYRRLLSFYHSKVRKMADPDPHVNRTLRAMGLVEGMPFAAMVDVLARTHPLAMDLHCRPQFLFLEHFGTPVVDYVGHLERPDEFLREIERRSGVRLELVHENRLEQQPAGDVYSDPDLAGQVYRLYRRDFELLGYARDR